MRSIRQLCLIFFPIPLSAGLGTQLDVLLGVSLKQGGMLPKQSGQYLLDSFRVNSLIPAFQKIQEELENLHASNHWEILVMIFLGIWTLVGNLYFAWKLRKFMKKKWKSGQDLQFNVLLLTSLSLSCFIYLLAIFQFESGNIFFT